MNDDEFLNRILLSLINISFYYIIGIKVPFLSNNKRERERDAKLIWSICAYICESKYQKHHISLIISELQERKLLTCLAFSSFFFK